MPEHTDARGRNRLLQEVQAFRHIIRRERRDAGHVSTRAPKARHQTEIDRVRRVHGHDRKRGGRRLCGQRCRGGGSDDHVRIGSDDLAGKLGQTSVMALGRTALERDLDTFPIAQLAKPVSPASESHVARIGDAHRRERSIIREERDPVSLSRLLRLGDEGAAKAMAARAVSRASLMSPVVSEPGAGPSTWRAAPDPTAS